MSKSKLKINANTQNGTLDVAILDADTLEPLPNFSISDCNTVRSDNTDIQVSWQGTSVITNEKPVRAQFKLYNSEIYSFWTEQPN